MSELAVIYQGSHDAHDQVHGPVDSDHDHISIRDARVVQVVCERIGRLIDLTVREDPLRSGGRLGLDDVRPVRVSLGGGPEALVDWADEARPVEVFCGIGTWTTWYNAPWTVFPMIWVLTESPSGVEGLRRSGKIWYGLVQKAYDKPACRVPATVRCRS